MIAYGYFVSKGGVGNVANQLEKAPHLKNPALQTLDSEDVLEKKPLLGIFDTAHTRTAAGGH